MRMDWLLELFHGEGIATSIIILALVAAAGLALGSVKVYGIGFGVAGVLFSGLLFAHFGLTINEHVLEFAREFGLILFVYTIGLQVGPGFISSLRRDGLPLNLLAAGIVLLGAAVTLLSASWAAWIFPRPSACSPAPRRIRPVSPLRSRPLKTWPAPRRTSPSSASCRPLAMPWPTRSVSSESS